jgi:Protein of unknown function (DUF295)
MILQTFRDATKSRLYSILDRKAYNMPHCGLDLSKMWIAATWRGWLVVTDLNPTKESRINLLNPLTNLQIPLPSWTSFYMTLFNPINFATLNRVIVVSPDSTTDPGKCSVCVVVGNIGFVHYYRIGGDNRWKCLHPYMLDVEDLTVYRGLLYAVQFNGSLLAMELKYPSEKPTFVVKGTQRRILRNYIVESVSGELLLIRRLRRYVSGRSDETSGFTVCKLAENHDKLAESTWEEIESLGDQTLFVGYNGARCFNSRLYPGIEKNCIYFAHDFRNEPPKFSGDRNVGVYFMKDKRIEYFEDISSARSQVAAVWFSPY